MSNDPPPNDLPDSEIDIVRSDEEIPSQPDLGQVKAIFRRELRILQAEFARPLPYPDHLAQYEEALPGAADRILTEFEKEAANRRRLEEKAVHSNIKLAERGQWIGLIVALSSLAGSGLLIYADKPWGVILLLVSATGLASAFLRVRTENKREREGATQDAIPAPPLAKRDRI